MANLLDGLQLVEGFAPVDLQTAANNGDWVNSSNYHGIAVVFYSGVGTAGDDPTLTIQQATDNAGTSAKALNFTEIYVKQAASSLAAVANYTVVTQAAANTYTEATSAEQVALWSVQFDPIQLDVGNGFDHLRAPVADFGPWTILRLALGGRTPGQLWSLVRAQLTA